MLAMLIWCAYFSVSYAQSFSQKITVIGKTIDSTNLNTLDYVTITIINKSNKEVIETVLSSNNGNFSFTRLNPNQYVLILSYVGYKTKTITLPPLKSTTLDLGTIYLIPISTQLQEIQVTAQRSLIERTPEKTAYNVELDPEVSLLSTFEMMRKVPMLSIDAEDNIMLNGQESYQILINGRRSALFTASPGEILKSIPAASFKQIEIFTNPPARYEASGNGGVINIITHKRSITGYNGSVNLNGGHPASYNGSTSLTATAGKVGLTGRYSNSYTNRPGNSSRFYRLDYSSGTKLEQKGEGSNTGRAQYAGGELTWDLSPTDQLTASFGLNESKTTGNYVQQVRQLGAGGEILESFQNINSSHNEGKNKDITLSYQRSFTNNDSRSLSIDLSLNDSDNGTSSEFTLQPLVNYTGRQSVTRSSDLMREYNLQADYVQPLGKQSLEMGFKSILQESSSNYFYKNMEQETGLFLLDSALSNSFDYRQDVHAAYASLHLRNDNWSLRTGFRVEETILSANFRTSATGARQQYRNLFPNLTLTRMLQESSSLKFSYSQRIQRPGLYDLNPYVDATDPLNISYGNPELAPATSHVLQLEYAKYIKTTSLNTSLSHHFTNEAIQYFTVLGEDSVARSTYGNLGQDRRYNLTLSSNTTIAKKLSLSVNAMANYVSYSSSIEGNEQSREGFTYNARANASYRFGKSWRVSGNVSYNSPNLMLQGRTAGYTWSSLSLNKNFLKEDKASIGLSVRSPFEKFRRSVNEVDDPRFYQFRESFSIMRQYSLAFNYRFGKLR